MDELTGESGEAWQTYRCRIGGKLADVRVDMLAGRNGPDVERRWLVYVSIDLARPDTEGLETDEERDEIHELEADLAACLASQLDARHVGAIVTAGRRDVFFYAPSAHGLDDAIDEVFEDSEYTADLGVQEDAGWDHYYKVLLPTPPPEA